MQQDGDFLRGVPMQQRLDEGTENLRGVVTAGDAVFVVRDANEPRIFERLDLTERHVRRGGVGGARVVDDVVRDEARRGRLARALALEVVAGPLDDVHRGAAGDLRVGLDVGDEQLDRPEVARDRFTEARA